MGMKSQVLSYDMLDKFHHLANDFQHFLKNLENLSKLILVTQPCHCTPTSFASSSHVSESWECRTHDGSKHSCNVMQATCFQDKWTSVFNLATGPANIRVKETDTSGSIPEMRAQMSPTLSFTQSHQSPTSANRCSDSIQICTIRTDCGIHCLLPTSKARLRMLCQFNSNLSNTATLHC